ncbi:hypothetical protein BJ878DRAFT_539014 [Calycina marina]|uniref:Uncharacterized protein n=1 Tax=Calycina marina TaxID=1763456 RepID=A0A9P7Z9D1_9HELO|nr:hypothetical protein BJ878DRAFT_539014 [Calycina marina]
MYMIRRNEKEKCSASIATLVSTAELVRENGFSMDVVTIGGGTVTAEICASLPGITKVQPGFFIFIGSDYRNAVGGLFEHNLTIPSATISKSSSAKRVTIGGGLKTLMTDSGFAEAKDLPRITCTQMGD